MRSGGEVIGPVALVSFLSLLFLAVIEPSAAKADQPSTVILPPPPTRLIEPKSGEVIDGPISEREFVWSIVGQAVKYHLEISPDRNFYRIVREVYPEDNRHTFEKLPSGTYFWRVSSIDEKGMEGRPGPIQYFVYPRR